MKSLFTIFFLIVTMNVFGQGYTWTNWQRVSCYSGIQYKVGGKPWPTGGYEYVIVFKSTYPKKVSFSYDWDLSTQKNDRGFRRESINSGSETRTSGTETYVDRQSSNFEVNINKVCFDPSDYCSINGSGSASCFADCDNNSSPRILNCKDASITSQQTFSNSNQNSTYQTQQPNNSAYNKQADLSEAKRVQEITDKSKTYREYYEKATAAGQAGNYDLAIANWKSAIEVSVNDFQRENAQQWLQQVQNAKKNSGGPNTQLYNVIPQPNVQQAPTMNQDAIRAQNIANTAVAVAQLGNAVGEIIEANRNLKIAEKELYTKIYSKEQPNQEAIDHLKNYFKYKKRSRNCTWTGLVAGFGGLGLSVYSLVNLENFLLSDIGNGIAITGGVILFAGFPASFKSIKHFGKANKLASQVSKIDIKPSFASNKQGNHIGLNIRF